MADTRDKVVGHDSVAEDDLAEYVDGLDQDDADDDDDEDVIEVSALERLAEIERDLGLVSRQPAHEQEDGDGPDR